MGIHHGPRPTGNAAFVGTIRSNRLYSFTNFTFTSPNEDPFAPSKTDITNQSAYSSSNFAGDPTFFDVIDGIQYFRIPETGTYRITCQGPAGKDPSSNGANGIGHGGKVRGDFSFEVNDLIGMLVGHRPPTSGSTYAFHGGAGGTFVVTSSNTTSGSNISAVPLLVAGGGSSVRSTNSRPSADANMSPNGKNGSGRNGGTQGTESPGGGHNATGGGGAAGWSGIGDAHGDTRGLYVPAGYPGNSFSTSYLPARGFISNGNPSIGGIFNTTYSTSHRGSGGFGGGGPGGWGGAGGAGGYSGGGNDNNGGYAGGGGSFISSNATNVGTSTGSWSSGSGYYTGHNGLATSSGLVNLGYNTNANGQVIIEKL
jgi:hypothetical protein